MANVFKLAAVTLDDPRRCDVVLVTSDQDGIDIKRTSDHQCLPQRPGREPSSAKLGAHAVANMTAERQQGCVELVPERDTPDDVAIDHCREKRGGDPSCPKRDAATVFLKAIQVVRPRLRFTQAQQEGEALFARFAIPPDPRADDS
jgi:hypothetical protein